MDGEGKGRKGKGRDELHTPEGDCTQDTLTVERGGGGTGNEMQTLILKQLLK